MKYSKRFIFFTLTILVSILVWLGIEKLEDASIADFRGGFLDENTWNPLVAKDVNSKPVHVRIDNRNYSGTSGQFYMNGNRDVMIPIRMVRDAVNCSAHLYQGETFLVEKYNLSAELTLDSDMARLNGEDVYVKSSLARKNDHYYVSINDLSMLLGYTCSFDYATNTLVAADTAEVSSILPERYDLRERDRMSKIRNQGNHGTCWAFAAIGALESTLLPEQSMNFSAPHMSTENSFSVDSNDGGKYTMGMAYLAAWQGPVAESEEGVPLKHVQEMRIPAGKDYKAIKEAVFKYGGVQTSLYSTIKNTDKNSPYYNKETNSYCYIGTAKPNHDVVIIGWDDLYSKDNFPAPLEGDGAFICQNSWGEQFGDGGVFYVSYYDTNIGTHNVVYSRVEDVGNYDRIYQSDLCGWVGQIGYNKQDIYGANIFTAESREMIAAAGFYATGANTSYKVYIVKNFQNTSTFAQKQLVASGTLDQAGFYTIDFEKPVAVNAQERYAVVVYLNTPGTTHPLAIEYNSGEKPLETVNLDDGEGYISYSGEQFLNIKEKQQANLCIKAYTRKTS